MVYTEKAIFKRDKTNRQGKETNTIRVTGLSVNSKFGNNEKLTVLKTEDFTQLENQLSTKDDKIRELENQLSKANTEIENLKSTTPETVPDNPKYYQELIQAKDEINNLNQIINNRNGLLLNTQGNIYSLFDELATEISTLYNNTITEANTKTLTNIQVLINTIKEVYSTVNGYNEELETQKELHNSKVENSNFITRALHKDSFKLQLDTSKLKGFENQLKEINDNCITYNDIVKPIEIPASKITEIKLNAQSKKFDIKELYIDTGNEEETDKVIITPDTEE